MDQRIGAPLEGWGLVPLRVAVGVVFLMHGGQKLFVYGLAGTAGAMTDMGIPLPQVAAIVVTAVEFLGGLAILLGLFARWPASCSPLIWRWPFWRFA